MSLEEDARKISDDIIKENEMTEPNEPPTVEIPPSPNLDIPNLDTPSPPSSGGIVQNLESLDVHYSVKRPRDTYEAGPITNLTDASTFARILADLTGDLWNVLETRTTVTSVGTFGPQA